VHHIPPYDYYNDPYSLSRKPATPGSNKILKSRATSASHQKHQKSKLGECTNYVNSDRNEMAVYQRKLYESKSQSITRALSALERLWQEKDIPREHR
jgi:hypothetical protein